MTTHPHAPRGKSSANRTYPSPTDFPPADPGKATPIVVCAGQVGCRFRVTRYDGERIHEREMSEGEMRQIDPLSVNLYLNEPEGRLVYKGADGEPQEPRGWPGLVGQKVLIEIQKQPGIFLSPRTLAALTGIHALAGNGTLATLSCGSAYCWVSRVGRTGSSSRVACRSMASDGRVGEPGSGSSSCPRFSAVRSSSQGPDDATPRN